MANEFEPDASSASENVVESVPAVEPDNSDLGATEVGVAEDRAKAAAERERFIPRERFDEVNGRRRAAEERLAEAEDILRQMLQKQQSQSQRQDPVNQYDEDPSEVVYKRMQPHLQSIEQQVFSLKDERERDKFWKGNEFVAEDVQEAVEERLGSMRRAGYRDISRNDVLAYELGSRSMAGLRTKTAAPVAPPAVNKVAHSESGGSARRGVKSLESYTPEELDKLPLVELENLMRGRTF